MSYSSVINRVILPVCALALLASSAQARYINLSDLPKDSKLREQVTKLEKNPKDKDAGAAIKKASDAGDKDAQFAYAWLLQNGFGGFESKDKDAAKKAIAEAKTLYDKAGKAGNLGAANNLLILNLATAETTDAAKAAVEAIEAGATSNGKVKLTYAEMFLEGTGVAKDPEMAVRWLQRASDTEPNEAAYMLGLVAEAAKDEESCVKNLAAAAKNGHVQSMIYLGTKILYGRGVQGSADAARSLFQQAVDAGVLAAKVNLGIISEVEASQEKDEAKKKEHFKKALALYKEAEADKVNDALLKLGYYYENGLGVDKNVERATEYYQKGADAGMSSCDYSLAMLNEATKDDKKIATARAQFYKAAKAGLPDAQVALAERYRSGKSGLDKDPIAAMAWYEKAAKAGDLNSQLNMANILETGEAGMINIKAAAEIYLEAAKKGAPVAMLQIADMLEKGRGLKQDLVQAYAYMTACTKAAPPESEIGKMAKERLAKIKGDLKPDELKAGDEAFQKLTGQPNTPAPAKAAETPASPATGAKKK
jgi:TPR repeat protein